MGRALLDRKFLDALLKQPEEALKDSQLSAEERAQITKTVREGGPGT